MERNILGRIGPAHISLGPLVIEALRKRFPSPDYRFEMQVIERGHLRGSGIWKEGVIVSLTNHVVPPAWLEIMRRECPKEEIPGPDATCWSHDYKLSRFWLAKALEVWDEIPVEFRGPATEPHTLVEKVQLMIKEIEKLRAERSAT